MQSTTAMCLALVLSLAGAMVPAHSPQSPTPPGTASTFKPARDSIKDPPAPGREAAPASTAAPLDSAKPTDEDAEAKATDTYLKALFDDMRRSPDPHTQAWGLVASARYDSKLDCSGRSPVTERYGRLSALVAKYPDDLLVQWTVAGDCGDAAARARANVQRIEADNAAAWTLSQGGELSDLAVIRKMATARRYDEHNADQLKPWLAAVQKFPFPTELTRRPDTLWTSVQRSIGLPATATETNYALMMSRSGANVSMLGILSRWTCGRKAMTDAGTRDACVAAGRLMLHSKQTLAASMIGATILRNAGALDAGEWDLARHVYWWRQEMDHLDIGNAFPTYLTDYLSSSSEVEAFRRAANRAGKADPHEGWISPLELPDDYPKHPGEED